MRCGGLVGDAVRSLALHNLNAAIQGTVLSIGLAILIILGGREIEAGTMTVGDLAPLNAYFLRLARPRMTPAGRRGVKAGRRTAGTASRSCSGWPRSTG